MNETEEKRQKRLLVTSAAIGGSFTADRRRLDVLSFPGLPLCQNLTTGAVHIAASPHHFFLSNPFQSLPSLPFPPRHTGS